jgi:2-succinyl-5-enolpyruvyl-6-hydroxy-3-cyclohexene-1-carboxylate synthase
LRPDLVVKLGGPVVSKSLKLMLRRSRPEHIWLLQDEPKVIDTFKGATRLLPVSLLPFIKALPEKISATGNGEYFSTWSRHDEKAGRILTVKLADLDFCEIAVMHKVLQQLPDYGNLHLGNSSIVRLASMVGFIPGSRQQVFSNRGTSGIDGILSTAVGSALASQVLTTVILGDLSFFYDRNALWNRYVPEHLRVVVFNNDGGGIFRLLEGSRELPELNHHFEVEHGLSAEMTAKEHGLEYLQCNDWRSLEACLPQLFREKSGPALLEIFFDKNVSSRAFFEFKSEIEEIK